MRINKKQTAGEQLHNNVYATTNNEGGLAFNIPPKEKLINICLTRMFGEPKFYPVENDDDEDETGDGLLSEREFLVETIKKVAVTDPEFVLKTAMYARNVMNLRTTPIVILVESANLPVFKTTGLIRSYLPQIVMRADEITEVLAYQLYHFSNSKIDGKTGKTTNTKAIPNQLIRGLKDKFGDFSEYQLAKYNRKGMVSLKDAVRLVHPKPVNKSQEKLYNRILTDSLKTPETWETTLSDWKNKGFESKGKAWESIIDMWTVGEKVRNYMAMLRNINNILSSGVDIPHRNKVANALINEKAVLNSKQLPFRFYSAYKVVSKSSDMGASQMLDAVETAMEISVNNLPTISGTTFMSADNSGSMETHLSEKSKVTYKDIANLMQAISLRVCDNPQTSVFAETFQIVNATKKTSIIETAEKFKNICIGYSTNGYLIMEHLLNKRQKVDRIMVFTDLELYDDTSYSDDEKTFAEAFMKYKTTINPKVKLYLFDLSGYGKTVIPPNDRNTVFVSGWSEKILEFVNLFELGGVKMIDEIENYKVWGKTGVKQDD